MRLIRWFGSHLMATVLMAIALIVVVAMWVFDPLNLGSDSASAEAEPVATLTFMESIVLAGATTESRSADAMGTLAAYQVEANASMNERFDAQSTEIADANATATATKTPTANGSETATPDGTLTATPNGTVTATSTITPTSAISGTATAEPNLSADLAVATPEGGYEDLGRTHENALRIGMALGFGDSVTITRVDPPVGGRRQFFCFLLNGEEMCGWCARTGTPALDVGDTATRIGDWVIPASRADQPIHIDPPNNGGNDNPVATATRNVVTATNPPTATNQSTYTPRPSYTPRNTSTVIPSDTPYPTDTDQPNQPTNTPRPSYTPRSSVTPIPSDTLVPTNTSSPTATATVTPTLTPTQTPTNTATSLIINDPCIMDPSKCTPTPRSSTPTPDDRTPQPTPTQDCGIAYPCPATATPEPPVPTEPPPWCPWIPIRCPDPKTPTPTPTDTPTSTECPTEVPTWTPRPSRTPTSTRTNTPIPTDTPEPTVVPTDTPVPSICMQDWPKTPAQAYATLGWRDDWSAEYQANGSWGWKLAQSAKPPTRPFTPGICLNEGFSGDPQQWTAIGNGDKVTELLLKFPGGNGGTVWNETRVEIAEYVFCKTWKNILLRPDHPNWTPWAFGFPKPKFCDGIPVPQANNPILQFVPTGQINRRYVPKGTINRRFVPKATPRRLIVVATAVPPTPEPQVEVIPNGDPVVEAPPPPAPEQPTEYTRARSRGDFSSSELVVLYTGNIGRLGTGLESGCRLTGHFGNGDHEVVPYTVWLTHPYCEGLEP